MGLKVDPDKVNSILNFPTTTNATEFRRFIGFASRCKRFMPDFSKRIAPLTRLIKKHSKWHWDNGAEKSFINLKNCLVSATILMCAEFSLPFGVQTDTSQTGLGWYYRKK